MKKYLNEGYLALLFGIIAFIYFLYTGLTRDKITSENDLIEIRGKYLRHSFKDNKGFKNFTHQYYIWTQNYSNAFQVQAEHLGIFSSKDFITNVNQVDDMTITIPKKQIERLNTEDNVFVMSIESDGTTYLDMNKVLEIERGLAASNTDYYFGVGFLLAGLFVFLRNKAYQT